MDTERAEHGLQKKRKRKILAVEDNALNMEILTAMLEGEYEVLTAENGYEGIRLLKEHREELSLVLLDVYMPECSGFDFLKITQKDPYLSAIPVVVTTGSNKPEDEEICLRLGALDFITKPYNAEIMLGRIRNIIRLRESLSTLAVVEHDSLTGLYNMSAFYHHAGQIMGASSGGFDLTAVKVRDLRTLNSIYGQKKSDEVLKYIADELTALLPGNLIGRQNGDFYILTAVEKRMKSADILENGNRISAGCPVPNVRLLVGLYPGLPKNLSTAELCSRVATGLRYGDTGGIVTLALYNEEYEKRQMEEQRLLLRFEPALRNHEFVVYLQPKVEITTGKILAAEALVRWIGPDGKMIPPGSFIPLLEREDMICKLDEYMFRTVCRYQKEQKDSGRRVVPISVNLSRNSLYRKNIIECYRAIAAEENMDLSLIPIEITESAVVSDQRIRDVCNAFVAAGFRLHMDDFGSGYSSMSSLAALPFSVLKIDKSLTDHLTTEKGVTIIQSVIEAAQALGLKVVAEGVESREQAEVLARMECDLIQGFYYSRPVSAEAFELLMASEDVYSDKKVAELCSGGILSLHAAELKRYLISVKTVFACARIVTPETGMYQTVEKDGSLSSEQGPCYAVWKRHDRCENCISMRALETKKTQCKTEVLGGRVYLIYAVYVEIDGTPRVIELINSLDEYTMPGAAFGRGSVAD